eukprot:SM000049S16762  [mRNA]  locus=s49:560970:563807:- [translate_table: standard]
MGKGGDAGACSRASRRAPSAKPPFTIGDLKKAIPPHCFRRSLLTSSAYLAADLAAVAALVCCTRLFDGPGVPRLLSAGLLWPAYWLAQGCVATGVWVIAHECGHQAFCDHAWLNDAVGMALHSALLVPYFSWKYSHRRHHSNTGSTERDEVFVPQREEDLARGYKELSRNSISRMFLIVFVLTLGWPLYLATNVTGRKYEKAANHFNPYAPIFNSRERVQVLISDAGLVAVLAGLYALGSAHGYVYILKVYGIPLVIVNCWLVLITLLQHTHPELPHYDGAEWDWLRGALATVDRNYGLLNHVFHHIADTHVAHHLFSTMPHYHAEEATQAIKPILGEYYSFDNTPIAQALWREMRECVHVAPEAAGNDHILWFNNEKVA